MKIYNNIKKMNLKVYKNTIKNIKNMKMKQNN